MSRHSHYLFEVVPLLVQCQMNLKMAISQIHFSPGRYESLFRLQNSLLATEKLLYTYVFKILRECSQDQGAEITRTGNCNYNHGDVLRALDCLKNITTRETRNSSNGNNNSSDDSFVQIMGGSCLRNPQDPTIYSRTNKGHQGAESQLLFRLIVTFQLLLVRIDDAHYVITGQRIEERPNIPSDTTGSIAATHHPRGRRMSMFLPSLGVCCLGAAGMVAGVFGRQQTGNLRINYPFSSHYTIRQMIGVSAKLGSSVLGFVLLKGFVNVCWMTDKVIRSNIELLEWNHQWELIQANDGYRDSLTQSLEPSPKPSNNKQHEEDASSITIDEKSRTLIEYARKYGRKSHFWRSTGEIRFLMVKRFMDIYYASVGVGVHCTKDNSIFLPLVAGAAASFYTITGAPTPTVVNDETSRDLIQHAWGMVSLPVLKNLMLQASRLVKGASVADRIVFCGVPCFILSKAPAPELAAVLQRQANVRSGDSSANLSQLSTIAETEIHLDESMDEAITVSRRKSFVGSKDGQYRQRDVILHLTGGGFFAHTIASDLPYLLDWSASTGSVVICPEYSLLPENQYPTQLNQIEKIYAALASGNTGADLGFDANSIIVTGESAGGNLAAALCVKLAMQNMKAESQINNESGDFNEFGLDESNVDSMGVIPNSRMPDAIMLSCPALNLTTELSHSRVIGTEDPVLPNALISAISEAYLPAGTDSRDSLVSPFYAEDQVLRRFPPTLLFASSKDPLLDDSVTFNERLRVLGVDSELMAVHNVPHAYLGLGTAGFPEAVQVQQYAMDWLSTKFS